jgi:hypothetical protein
LYIEPKSRISLNDMIAKIDTADRLEGFDSILLQLTHAHLPEMPASQALSILIKSPSTSSNLAGIA